MSLGIGLDLTIGGAGVFGPTFSPADLEPFLWLKADEGVVESGNDVSQWTDQSANGNNLVQAAGANQPLYTAANSDFNGKPTVDFNGSSHFLRSGALSSSLTDTTTFITFYVNSIAVNGDTIITSEVTNSKRLFYGTGGNRDGVLRNSGSSNILNTVINNTYTFMYQFDGTTLRKRTNGGGVATVSFASDTINEIGLGYSIGLGGRYSDFDIAEFIVYNKVLTTDEIEDVFNYTNVKYAIY